MSTKIKDIPPQKVGKFAVFRHSTKLSRAHFSVLHDTYEAASGEAVRLLASSAEKFPQDQHYYYVVEVGAVFSAGPEGLKSEER